MVGRATSFFSKPFSHTLLLSAIRGRLSFYVAEEALNPKNYKNELEPRLQRLSTHKVISHLHHVFHLIQARMRGLSPIDMGMGEVNPQNRGAAASALAGTYFHVSSEAHIASRSTSPLSRNFPHSCTMSLWG
jgi:hypothetical protein